MNRLVFLTLLLIMYGNNAISQQVHPSTGTVKRFEKFPSKYVDARNVDVWLPEGFSANGRYAVLYMHDGQMLFDSASNWNHQEWSVEDAIGRLLAGKKIRDCIVVGIWNNGPYRHTEYFPYKALSYLTPEQKSALLSATTGADNHIIFKGVPVSDNYLSFLVKELKPFIDSVFPTLRDRGNTFIAGSSMGGLISLYAICEYPGIFGGAACLSTHWTGIYTAVNNPVPGACLAYLEDHLPPPAHHRIYFDYGTETLDSLYKPFQLQADKIMKAGGYTPANWVTKEFPGEGHTEKAWAKRFDIPVLFLLKK